MGVGSIGRIIGKRYIKQTKKLRLFFMDLKTYERLSPVFMWYCHTKMIVCSDAK